MSGSTGSEGLPTIAYLPMEVGVEPGVRAAGLGVRAGDIVRAVADVGQPLHKGQAP